VSDVVWYVAYGSNMLTERLRCYLEGGRADGSRRGNPGARDGRPASAQRRVELGHPLLFGGPSPTWDGGPAYLDVARPGRWVARGWRVTRSQFEDVVAQENRLDPGEVTISPAMVRRGGVVGDHRYGRVVPLAPIDGEPTVTVTYVRRPPPRAPDPAYVSLIRLGLGEVGLRPDEVAALLDDHPQVAIA
jgi:hypothetical protein